MRRFPKKEAEIGFCGKELEYRIIAVNKVGQGEPSNTVMVVL